MATFKVIAHRANVIFRNRVELDIFRLEGSKLVVVTGLLSQEFEENSYVPDTLAPVTLRTDEAQGLMDSLWECGLRPTEGAGSAGALAATQKHLEDMRRLVFEMIVGAPK